MSASARVVLVRHGKTALNKGGESAERIRGWRDIALTPEGRADALRVAREFAGQPVHKLYSSPLSRAMDTAVEIKKLSPEADGPHAMVSLMPWQLGAMTGEPVDAVLPAMNYYVEHEDECPEKGEPFARFRKRFLSFLVQTLDAEKARAESDVTLLVTHSRGVQLTKAWVAGGARPDLSISVPAMLDYRAETATGGHLWVRAT